MFSQQTREINAHSYSYHTYSECCIHYWAALCYYISSMPPFYCMSFLLRITLNTLTLNVKSDKVYTRHGVPISVTGIAQVCFENWMTEIPLGFY